MNTKGKGIYIAMGWMFLISLLLFWLPVFGPLIAGFVGGKKAGDVVSAIIAVILPALVSGFLLFAVSSALTGLPIIGAIIGLGISAFLLYHSGLLLVGAIIGGAVA
jgi:hypothetical protein